MRKKFVIACSSRGSEFEVDQGHPTLIEQR